MYNKRLTQSVVLAIIIMLKEVNSRDDGAMPLR